MKNISKHHDVQRKYREKIQNKQELNTYVRGWFLFILFAVLLIVWSYFLAERLCLIEQCRKMNVNIFIAL